MTGRIAIVGAGPAGLGAAWRLNELRHPDWLLLEAAGHAGGLSASYTDGKGFTWDIGGHVFFSHYAYFDAVLDSLLGADEWGFHERQSWIRMRGGFLPYPFQHNLWRLPKEEVADCLCGLVQSKMLPATEPADFREWLLARFGAGMARSFLFPYNEKVWAHPLQDLGCGWMRERVAEVDPERVLRNTILQRDDPGWGPNRNLRYPLCGGVGEIWTRCAHRLPAERLRFDDPVLAIDACARRVRTRSGAEHGYDALISTMPLPALWKTAGMPGEAETECRGLLSTATHAIGIGLAGAPAGDVAGKNWVYFPEDNCPFYRVTVLSNYSPFVVPDAARFWSLLCEVSESGFKPVDASRIVDQTVAGLLNTGLIERAEQVVSTWHYCAPIGYPVPGRQRDTALARLLPELEERGIYSRGRLGAWKYEVSNQDHSFMQGVEAVDRILLGKPEVTLAGPNLRGQRPA